MTGRQPFAEAHLEAGTGRLDDAVAPDNECAVERAVLLDGLGHGLVENVALFLVVPLEGIQDHLLRVLEHLFRASDDQQRPHASV